MGFFSFLKPKEKTLKCDWCGREIEEVAHSKYVNNKKFNFCSESCKQYFRKSGKGKSKYSCPTCHMS